MKFFYAKRNNIICRQCTATIDRGDVCVRTYHRKTKRSYIYHYQCYLEYITEKVRQSAIFWLNKQLPRKPRGRPRKYKDPKIANRLMALIAYHEKAGNVARANEVRRELDNACL